MKTTESRFWSKVDKSGDCWIWLAGKSHDGYGVFYLNKTREYAHRFAYRMAGRDLPKGKMLDHRCYQRSCVRPSHLRPVTNKQNMENRPGAQRNSKSGVRGVYFDRDKWGAYLKHAGKCINAGRYPSLAEAETAVIARRNELFTNNLQDRKAS